MSDSPSIKPARGWLFRNLKSLSVMASMAGLLTLNAATGDWRLQGGTILGGTIEQLDGSRLVVQSNGTLDGVTVEGPIDLNSAYLYVKNGLTLNGTMTLGSSAALYFNEGSQTLGGSGEVVFSDNWYQGLLIGTSNATLTIGSGITIRSG